MSFSHRITVAVLAFLPLAATAQQPQQANPADAYVTVPAIGYVSAFENYRATPDEKTSPDQVWRAANEEIASKDAHGGHTDMPGMTPAASGNPMSMPGMGTTKPEPKADAAPSDPHAGHQNMPGMGAAGSGNHMSMPGMGATKPEPKPDAAPSDPHAVHHNMQGK